MSTTSESNITVDFGQLFDKVKAQSEMRSRRLPDEIAEAFTVTDTDETFFQSNINEVVAGEIANKLAIASKLRIDGKFVKIVVDNNRFGTDSKRFVALLEQAFVLGMLSEWSKYLGEMELYQVYQADFLNRLDQFVHNIGTVKSVKRPPLSF